MEQLYIQWCADRETAIKSQSDKAQFIESCVQIRQGDQNQRANQVYFYALDLIKFGIENKAPEAIRMGESWLGDVRMPVDLQHKLKSHLLEKNNNEAYWSAMKRTGPVNNTPMYWSSSVNEAASAPFTPMDDPAVAQLLLKTTKKED